MKQEEKEWGQLDCFFTDCLIPSTEPGVKTLFIDIWNTYNTYCIAVNQAPELNKVAFSRRLASRYHAKHIKGVKYYCLKIRENLFIRE